MEHANIGLTIGDYYYYYCFRCTVLYKLVELTAKRGSTVTGQLR